MRTSPTFLSGVRSYLSGRLRRLRQTLRPDGASERGDGPSSPAGPASPTGRHVPCCAAPGMNRLPRLSRPLMTAALLSVGCSSPEQVGESGLRPSLNPVQNATPARRAAPIVRPGEVRWVPGELVVKLRSRGQAAVEGPIGARLADHQSLAPATVDGSKSLDGLVAELGIRGARPLFVEREGLSTRQAEALLLRRANAARDRRKGRAAQTVALPELANIYVFLVPTSADLERAAERLASDPHVEYAHPNYLAQASMIPNDPFYSSVGSWGQSYDDLWGLKRIDASVAWDLSQGAGTLVAVVDTGIDETHPDIAANLWSNPLEIPGNGIDDDGNGHIDDVIGWNFVNNNGSPHDGHGHGTHVSGTIAAIGNNSIGVIGVAPQARVIAVKGLDNNGSGPFDRLAQAVVYAATSGADVINNSWGCSASCPSIPVVEDAVRAAHALGAVVVFAAGNSSADVQGYSPQNMGETITVGAVDHLDVISSFSNRGVGLDIAAPGGDSADATPNQAYRNILSLRSAGTNMQFNAAQIVANDYYRVEGTSMAAPHVAGLAALILARHPAWSNEQVRQAIRQSADDIGSAGFDPLTGYGRINARRAVQALEPMASNITSPHHGAIGGAQSFDINGIAEGPGLSAWRLEFAAGAAGTTPASWTQIATDTTARHGTRLGTWDVSALPDGPYQLRLVTAGAGVSSEDRLFVTLTQVSVDAMPLAARVGSVLELRGMAMPADLLSYRLRIFDRLGVELTGANIQLTAGGTQRTSGVLGTWNTTAVAPGMYRVQLDVTTSSQIETVSTPVFALTDTSPGWPIALPLTGYIPLDQPLMVDLDGDQRSELIVALGDRVSVYEGDGSMRPGWPQSIDPAGTGQTMIQEGVAVGDVTGDGVPEIVAVTNLFRIFVWSIDGSLLAGWPQNFGGYSPMVADLDGDGRSEIICLGFSTVRVFAGDGTSAPGWPVTLPFGSVTSWDGMAVGDVDGDGVQELVVASGNAPYSTFLLDSTGHVRPGWPRTLPGSGVRLGYPVMADLDGDGQLDVVIAGGDGSMHAFNAAGAELPGWPVQGPAAALNPPAVADLDGDGRLEVVAGTAVFSGQAWMSSLSVWRADGTTLPGWPVSFAANRAFFGFGQPAIADVDGDGSLEVIASSNSTFWPGADALRAYRASGALVSGFPKITSDLGAHQSDGAAIGDLDGDGRLDLAWFDLNDVLYVWPLSGASSGARPWPLPRHDPGRTGTVPVDRRPDLSVSALSTAVTQLAAGGSLSAASTVFNAGRTGAGAFTVGFHLSIDGAFGGADDVAIAATRAVTALAAGASSSAATTLVIPAATPGGDYHLCASADLGSAVSEVSEANNARCTSGTIRVTKPDLVTTAISGPSAGATGTSITVATTVANQGSATAGAFYACVYLSTDPTITTADTRLSTRLVSQLAAGASSAASVAVPIPGTIAPGTYYLGAIADCTLASSESDEGNNSLLGAAIALSPGADLVVSGVSGPSAGVTGGALSISTTVLNQGIGTSAASSVGIYLSTDAVISTTDTRLGARSIGALLRGASSAAATTVTIPATLAPGTYYLGAIADYANQARESDEANNALVGSLITLSVGADLVMSAVTGPASGLSGASIAIATTMLNQGVGASSSAYVGLYLSTDPLITTADLRLGTRSVGALAAGASSSASVTLVIPASLAPGTYYLGAIADYSGVARESDETNNALSGSTIQIAPGADLVMSAVSGPASAGRGAAISIASTALNQGAGSSVGFQVGLYLSTDPLITTADVRIGVRSVGGLAAGAASSASTTLTLSTALAPGTYYLGAIADYAAAARESNEGNNALVGAQLIVQ